MFKKSFIALLLTTLLISGCSSNNNEKKDEDNNDDDYLIKEDTTIEFLSMLNSDYISYAEELIKSFEEKEPHVKVILSNPLGSGNYSMLEKTVIAGFFKEDYPDLVQCYPDNVVKYLAKGKAYNVDNYINNSTYGLSEEEKQDYISSFMQEGRGYKEEGTYSLPYCKSTELMYYNAEILLGLTIDGINNSNPIDEEYLNSLTWEELFDNLCPKLEEYNSSLPENEKILSDSSRAIVTYDSDENLFITLAEKYGYGYTSYDKEHDVASIDFDNPEMKSLISKFKSYKDKGYFETKYSYGTYVSSLFTAKNSLFTISSTAGVSYNFNDKNPFKVGVARLPHAASQGNNYCSINQGPSLCILDHKDNNRSLASFLLWKHMTSKDNSTFWSLKTGYMPIRNSSFTSEEYLASLVVNEETTLKERLEIDNRNKIAEVKEMTFNTLLFRGSGNARTNVGLLVRDCLLSTDLANEIDDIFTSYAEDSRTYINKD